MNKKMLIIAFLLMAAKLYAQPLPPSNPVPLDGGLFWISVAGVMYGISKSNSKKPPNDARRIPIDDNPSSPFEQE